MRMREGRWAMVRVSGRSRTCGFRRSLVNFWERYRLDADAWHLTYNGGESAIRVASGSGLRAVVTDLRAFEGFLGLLRS
jgi:hypothetical protein